ncbi:MAG TPA: type I 3-dehydroquinate dehydratase [Phycisphaerae bacterium]|nr:type I 3-dehydroquinate dehydratase [Phycisphaerae bacterium]
MIAVSLMSRSTDDALRDLARLAAVKSPILSAAKGGEPLAVELRLDALRDPDLARLLAAAPCPVVATCRPRREGGLYDGPEESRLELLRQAARLGAAYIDIEHDAARALGPVAPAKRIVSYHNFRETPPDLAAIHERLARLGADVVKIAVTARHILDCAAVLRLLRDARTPTIALAMGERGILTRILAPKFGSLLTYASFDADAREAGPGQITLSDMLNLYRVHRICRQTRVYGVIADPVAHSLSPAIHNTAFAALDLDAVYLPLWVEGDAAAFVNAMREFDFDGYSVTIPHKQKVLEAMDDLAPLARRVGAMNTILRRPDGSLFGTNTDISAAVASIEAVVGASWLKGKRALLLGAGGLGRAMAFALADAGAILTITDVDLPRAESLASEVSAASLSSRAQRSGVEGSRRAPLAAAKPEGRSRVAVHSALRTPPFDLAQGGPSMVEGPHSALDFDVVLNCSPVGMHPSEDASPVPKEWLRKDLVVYDAVYNPAETKLLRDARAAGCRTVAGIDHFLRQAVEQFELWTGQSAPVDTMRRVLTESLT